MTGVGKIAGFSVLGAGNRRRRAGLVLLVTMMVVAFTAVFSLGILESQLVRAKLGQRVADAERAELLANAGVQHAVALLLEDPAWRGESPWIALPTGGSNEYQFQVQSVSGGRVQIRGAGNCSGAIATKLLTHSF
ncbi:MAG: hypothetical protein KDB14_06475 [Planctomycetales bacterium]|nr:hypothetical protein [Planctomycetales bacterium]